MVAPMRVCVFFYGSAMNPKVLAEVVVGEVQVASLAGFALTITPRANLVEEEGACTYGLVGSATHEQLDRLYRPLYRPRAVLVRSREGQFQPALTYLCAEMEGELAEAAYVQRILEPAREYGFPAWYLRHIESFAPLG